MYYTIQFSGKWWDSTMIFNTNAEFKINPIKRVIIFFLLKQIKI